jgi:hypothetical protein
LKEEEEKYCGKSLEDEEDDEDIIWLERCGVADNNVDEDIFQQRPFYSTMKFFVVDESNLSASAVRL